MWQQTKLFTLSHIKAVSVPAVTHEAKSKQPQTGHATHTLGIQCRSWL